MAGRPVYQLRRGLHGVLRRRNEFQQQSGTMATMVQVMARLRRWWPVFKLRSAGGRRGGGHVKFTSQYGNPKGGQATIVNYGSETSFSASAGYTLFYTSSTDIILPLSRRTLPTIRRQQGRVGGKNSVFQLHESGRGRRTPDSNRRQCLDKQPGREQ